MPSRSVVVGAGKTGRAIVERLARIGPVVVLDKSEAELRSVTEPEGGDGEVKPRTSATFRHPVTTHHGDGTSRLVLEEVGGENPERVALVAVTGEDRTNLEICRLAEQIGFRPVVAIAIEASEAPKYDALGARAIVRSTVIGQAVEREMQFEGLSMATTVGLGKGEIVEFKVLPSSAVAGVPLREIDANGWRVAAIYRDDKLVLPTGGTAILPDDRVIVVGNPRILPLVAENLRIGLPMFPLRHGDRVVVYLPRGRDRGVESEGEVIALKTRATGLVRVWPRAPAERTVVDDATGEMAAARKTFDDAPLEGATLDEQVQSLLAAQPGVVLTRVARRTPWERLMGLPGRDGALCDALPCPVIFPHGVPHYGRIVYVVTEGVGDLAAADTAIDLARMFELPMEILRIDLPVFLGRLEKADAHVADAERRARLHHVTATTKRLEGNPIERIAATARFDDLVVITRRRGARDGYTRPDIALRVARTAPCSTLVASLDDD